MVQRQKIILQWFKSLLGRGRKKAQSKRIFSTKSLRRIEEQKHCGSIACRVFISISWGVWVTERCLSQTEEVKVQPTPPPPLRFYVLITPLLGSCLGRQGSSGSGSWAKTESSPEEQVLLESWQVGEYCSKGTARSRYSCQGRGQRLDRGLAVKSPHPWSHYRW